MYREYLLCLQSHASGSFLQKCINFVEPLKFSHFEGNKIPNFLPHCWFSLNNSATVKAATLAFCSIQHYYYYRDIRAKFGIPYSP